MRTLTALLLISLGNDGGPRAVPTDGTERPVPKHLKVSWGALAARSQGRFRRTVFRSGTDSARLSAMKREEGQATKLRPIRPFALGGSP
jgi:hypothetical protein